MPEPLLQHNAQSFVSDDLTDDDIPARRKLIVHSGLTIYKKCGRDHDGLVMAVEEMTTSMAWFTPRGGKEEIEEVSLMIKSNGM